MLVIQVQLGQFVKQFKAQVKDFNDENGLFEIPLTKQMTTNPAKFGG